MNQMNVLFRWLFWPTAVILVFGTTYLLWRNARPARTHALANGTTQVQPQNPPGDEDDNPQTPLETPHVEVVKARRGLMERVTVQVGSVLAFESVHLHAKVSGYLKTQEVDIGDRVKRGQILAVVDVPELEKILEKGRATVKLSEARVTQMKARVAIAEADLKATEAQVVLAEATAKSSTAWVSFRSKKFLRWTELFKLKSIDEGLVDEAKEQYEAAVESENAAKASVITSKAKVRSAEAKILSAVADVGEAAAQVKVAQSEADRAQVQLAYAQIIAPFDGIITQRTLFPGDFVRSASEGGLQLPLLTIQRTDRMRVIVQIPDREVPFTDPGDTATVEIDAFEGETFPAKVSRIAQSEDAQTRLMPVEIDLPNPTGKIRQGMFGKVTIILDREKEKLSLPSSCLIAGKADEIFVVRGGKAQRTKVKIGLVNTERIMVLKGVEPSDEVILSPPRSLRQGGEVHATLISESDIQTAGPK